MQIQNGKDIVKEVKQLSQSTKIPLQIAVEALKITELRQHNDYMWTQNQVLGRIWKELKKLGGNENNEQKGID